MGKAVEHTAAGSQARDGLAVVFLVEEEAGLLAVFDVDLVENTVFTDFRKAGAEKARRLRIAAVSADSGYQPLYWASPSSSRMATSLRS